MCCDFGLIMPVAEKTSEIVDMQHIQEILLTYIQVTHENSNEANSVSFYEKH